MPARKLPKPSDVDKFIRAKTELAALEAQVEKMALQLKAYGPGVYGGKEGVTQVTQYDRHTTDWGRVIKLAKVPPRVVAKCTTTRPVTKIEVLKPRV